jgi:CheY-like chemotaxis protein
MLKNSAFLPIKITDVISKSLFLVTAFSERRCMKGHSFSFLSNDLSNRDITEIEKLMSLGELIAGISHELNNPLSAILGYSEILQTLDMDAEIKKYAKNIHIAAIRSAKIVEGLLTFLRKKETEFNIININDVIKQTVSLFEYQMRTNNTSLVLSLSSGIPHIKGDFYKLQQVFFNIIINALQAIETWHKERRLLISSESIGNGVKVIVSDSGPGIDRDKINKIFSPFFTTKPNGTGLGLSIVQGIIKEHGGNIAVFSEGQGCSFTIELPATADNGPNSEVKDNSVTKFNRRVLIVDDDELVLDATSGIIEFMGCDVVFTTVASEGLVELKKGDFDFIFVDYRMPDMNGVDFIEKASGFIDIKKFILITGDVTLDINGVKQRYNIPVIQKPISFTELKKIISGGG